MPVPVPDHPVPAGPLAVRFHAYELPALRAGTSAVVTIDLENAGTAAWPAGKTPFFLSYHWLDRRGNPIVWDGLRTPLPEPVAPGARTIGWLRVAAPIPPGPYRLAVDLVDDARFWFGEVGNRPLEVDVDVLPRIVRRALAAAVGAGPPDLVAATRAALAAQEEPLVEEDADATAHLAAGCAPAPDWSRRVLDAHAEGYAVVAGSIAVVGPLLRRAHGPARALAPWSPGFGRAPAWSHPLVCPSVLAEVAGTVAVDTSVAGLPALEPAPLAEPWLCDGRIRVAVPVRALRPGGRPRA